MLDYILYIYNLIKLTTNSAVQALTVLYESSLDQSQTTYSVGLINIYNCIHVCMWVKRHVYCIVNTNTIGLCRLVGPSLRIAL